MPFREAHGVVAELVRAAVSSGRTLSQLSVAELSAASELLDESFYELLRDGAWLESKVSRGGTSLAMISRQLEHVREAVARARSGRY
jgi:argininosuccinate lyase